MNCPTCGKTRALLSLEPRTFWCPNCGTVGDERSNQAPKLVERCRRLEPAVFALHALDPIRVAWTLLGILEAINPLEDRPQ